MRPTPTLRNDRDGHWWAVILIVWIVAMVSL